MAVETFVFEKLFGDDQRQVVLDSTLRHHLLIVGQTGSGKTTTTLSLLDQLQHMSQTTIVFDPTGEYAQLPNAVTYRLGDNAYLEAGMLTASELQEVLQLNLQNQLRAKFQQAIDALCIQHNINNQQGAYKKINLPIADYQEKLAQLGTWTSDYRIQDLFDQLIEEFIIPYEDERADYQLLGQQYNRQAISAAWDDLASLRERLASTMFTTIFDTKAHPGTFKTELNFVLKMFLNHKSSHRTLVIDLSLLKNYENSQRAIISFLLKKILRMRLQTPRELPVNIVIDEAHRYLPRDERRLADNGIFQVLREGRKLHLKMILTTQSPLDLPARLRSQFSNVVIHRLAAGDEVASLPGLTTVAKKLDQLQTGYAFLKTLGNPAVAVTVNPPQWWS
ncbi:ATP-binding protein [Limosilactobacillus caccae]|uniref:ATP-binding protein n=1 Tax=Limosilactobacillus caccae TaxID=1926284 RepID=UPI0009F98C52|nr:ATP-binding protein [Limosilactobacillus caccae]